MELFPIRPSASNESSDLKNKFNINLSSTDSHLLRDVIQPIMKDILQNGFNEINDDTLSKIQNLILEGNRKKTESYIAMMGTYNILLECLQ